MAHFPIPSQLVSAAIPLFPQGGVPFSRGHTEHDIPTLTPLASPNVRSSARDATSSSSPSPTSSAAPSPALLILPGGGYMEHAFDDTLIELAESYESRGIATFILRYRLAWDGYHHPCQLLDGQRAVRMLRAQAADWNLDPQRITVLGFSAGGHLASMLATHFTSGDAAAADPIERVSSRPDAAVLIYPVISLLGPSGSAKNLLGPQAENEVCPPPSHLPHPQSLATQFSSHLQVTGDTPPTLLIHGADDATVPISHSAQMFDALQRTGTPSDFHAYPVGKHGFGCFKNDLCPPGWLSRMDDWLHHVAQWRELV